jgi:hypothetical protein
MLSKFESESVITSLIAISVVGRERERRNTGNLNFKVRDGFSRETVNVWIGRIISKRRR